VNRAERRALARLTCDEHGPDYTYETCPECGSEYELARDGAGQLVGLTVIAADDHLECGPCSEAVRELTRELVP